MTGPGDRSDADPAQGAHAPSDGFRKGAFGVTGSGDTSGFGGLVRVEPGGAVALHSTERPYGGYFDEVTDALIEAVGEATYAAAVRRVLVDRGEITYFVEREHLLTLVQALRDDEALRFELCSSVSGVDYLDSGGPAAGPHRPRLHAVYHLTSMTYRRRIRLEVAVTAEDPHVPSVTSVYPTADWHERETFDMFGIVFDGHAVGGLVVQRGQVVHPGHERRALHPVAVLDVLLDAGVQVADDHPRLRHRLALQVEDEAEDTVRRRVLRAHVDDEAFLADGVPADGQVPVAAGDGVDAALGGLARAGVRVGRGGHGWTFFTGRRAACPAAG